MDRGSTSLTAEIRPVSICSTYRSVPSLSVSIEERARYFEQDATTTSVVVEATSHPFRRLNRSLVSLFIFQTFLRSARRMSSVLKNDEERNGKERRVKDVKD